MSDLSKANNLEWLVIARNEIQILMLMLSQKTDVAKGKQRDRWHLLIGVAFSLWRAVFLIEPTELSRNANELNEHAKKFLEKIIKRNAITFSDDIDCRAWSGGYYLNNAIHRLNELNDRHGADEILEVGSDEVLKDVWNKSFAALQKAYEES